MSHISLITNAMEDLRITAWSLLRRKSGNSILHREDIIDCLFVRWSASVLIHEDKEKMLNAYKYYG
jgi:hypothetical protein